CLLSAFRTRRRPRPTLLPYTTLFRSDIDVEMEESDQAPAETEGRDAPFKARPAMRVEKSADKLINPEAQQVVSEVAAKPKKRGPDRKSTRLNSSHVKISYAVFCLKKK